MSDDSTNSEHKDASEQIPSLPAIPKRPKQIKTVDSSESVVKDDATGESPEVEAAAGSKIVFPVVPSSRPGANREPKHEDTPGSESIEPTVPVETTSVETTPMEGTSVEATPVEATPVETTPVETASEPVGLQQVSSTTESVEAPVEKAASYNEQLPVEDASTCGSIHDSINDSSADNEHEPEHEHEHESQDGLDKPTETTRDAPTPALSATKFPAIPSRPTKRPSASVSGSNSPSASASLVAGIPSLPQVPSQRPGSAAELDIILPAVPTSRPSGNVGLPEPKEPQTSADDIKDVAKDDAKDDAKHDFKEDSKDSVTESGGDDDVKKISRDLPKPKPSVAPRPSKLKEFKPTNDAVPPPKPKSKPAVASKIGALRASLFNDLNSMIAKGPPPSRGVPSPFGGQASVPSVSSNTEETASESTTETNATASDNRKSRARGPRGRRLPAAAKSEWTTDIAEVWSLEPIVQKDSITASSETSEVGASADTQLAMGDGQSINEEGDTIQDYKRGSSSPNSGDASQSSDDQAAGKPSGTRNPTPINFSKPLVGSPKKENRGNAVPPIVTDLDLSAGAPLKLESTDLSAASEKPQKDLDLNITTDKVLETPFEPKAAAEMESLDFKDKNSENLLADISLGTPISIKKARQQQQQVAVETVPKDTNLAKESKEDRRLDLAADYTVPPTPKNRLVSFELMSDMSLATPVNGLSPILNPEHKLEPFIEHEREGERGSESSGENALLKESGSAQAQRNEGYTILGDISVQNSPVVDQGLFSPPGPGFQL